MKINKFVLIITIVTLFSLLSLAPAQAVQAQATTERQNIIYNFYATDAYIKLADDSVIYNYGFIGGRQGVPLTYQKSFSPDGTSGGDNGYIPGGAPAPTGGELQDAEEELQGNAQFPGPMIYASVGDIVELRLKNLGVTNPDAVANDPHSIHLHALDVNAANDGVPETSLGAVPANLCLDGTSAPKGEDCTDEQGGPTPGAGNVIVYMFSPKYAGTYMYHCHQEADIHVTMGMYGAMVIYNPYDPAAATGPGTGKGGTLYGWKYDRDYVLLETETDVRQHCSEGGTYAGGVCPGIDTLPGQEEYNPVDFEPQYWFLNGLSFPNTIHAAGGPVVDSWENWIAAHPGYDPLIAGSVSAKSYDGSRGQKVLIRMINLGYETQPMHMHGFHGKVIGSDQRAWLWANSPTGNGLWRSGTPWGQGEEKNTLTIGSGETYEWLINMKEQAVTSTYPNGTGGLNGLFQGGTQSRYNDSGPVSNTQVSNPAIPNAGDPESTINYIGGPTVNGAIIAPEIPSQLFPFHNHDDYKSTNNGTYPGGMFTLIMPLP